MVNKEGLDFLLSYPDGPACPILGGNLVRSAITASLYTIPYIPTLICATIVRHCGTEQDTCWPTMAAMHNVSAKSSICDPTIELDKKRGLLIHLGVRV